MKSVQLTAGMMMAGIGHYKPLNWAYASRNKHVKGTLNAGYNLLS